MTIFKFEIFLIFFVIVNAKLASLPELIKQVKPAVATVYIYNDKWKMINQGTGFFISANLLVSTKHVFWKTDMRDAAFTKVVPYGNDSTFYYVNKVLIDSSEFDLIIVTLESMSSRSHIQPVLSLAPTHLEEGEDIFVIASPLDLPGVISTGIISAIHNKIDFQISASISTGSSGAPIFNSQGVVVGVVTGYFTNGQNINFGVTVSALLEVVKNIQPKKEAYNELQGRRLLDAFHTQGKPLNKLLTPNVGYNVPPEGNTVNDEFAYAETLLEWIRIQNTLSPEKTEHTGGGLYESLVNFPNNVWQRFQFNGAPPVCPLKKEDTEKAKLPTKPNHS